MLAVPQSNDIEVAMKTRSLARTMLVLVALLSVQCLSAARSEAARSRNLTVQGSLLLWKKRVLI